jgi:hypothetical protein
MSSTFTGRKEKGPQHRKGRFRLAKLQEDLSGPGSNQGQSGQARQLWPAPLRSLLFIPPSPHTLLFQEGFESQRTPDLADRLPFSCFERVGGPLQTSRWRHHLLHEKAWALTTVPSPQCTLSTCALNRL